MPTRDIIISYCILLFYIVFLQSEKSLNLNVSFWWEQRKGSGLARGSRFNPGLASKISRLSISSFQLWYDLN